MLNQLLSTVQSESLHIHPTFITLSLHVVENKSKIWMRLNLIWIENTKQAKLLFFVLLVLVNIITW